LNRPGRIGYTKWLGRRAGVVDNFADGGIEQLLKDAEHC